MYICIYVSEQVVILLNTLVYLPYLCFCKCLVQNKLDRTCTHTHTHTHTYIYYNRTHTHTYITQTKQREATHILNLYASMSTPSRILVTQLLAVKLINNNNKY